LAAKLGIIHTTLQSVGVAIKLGVVESNAQQGGGSIALSSQLLMALLFFKNMLL
jgi:hypothetical protein